MYSDAAQFVHVHCPIISFIIDHVRLPLERVFLDCAVVLLRVSQPRSWELTTAVSHPRRLSITGHMTDRFCQTK